MEAYIIDAINDIKSDVIKHLSGELEGKVMAGFDTSFAVTEFSIEGKKPKWTLSIDMGIEGID